MLGFVRGDEMLLERFKGWLERRGYAKVSCERIPKAVKYILRHHGYFRDEEELREYLFDYTTFSSSTRSFYIRCYRLFMEFVKNGDS